MRVNNFFRELLDPAGTVSSKRFAGLILLIAFVVGVVASPFIDLSDNSLELLKYDGVLGASLLGVNVLEKFIITKPNQIMKSQNNE